MPVEQQLRDLRRTLQRLAAAVMWRGGKVIPEERIPKHIVEKVAEQIVDVPPVPPLKEEIVEVRQTMPQELVQNRTTEQNVDISVPPLKEEVVEVRQTLPQELVQNRTTEQNVDTSVPPLKEEIVEVRQTIPQELVQNRNGPVPQFPEETDEVVKLLLAESMPERTVEQIGSMPVPQIAETTPQERIPERIVVPTEDVPVPQILKEVVEVGKILPQESISKRTCEHIIDVPVPQIREQIVEVAEITPQGRISERIVVQTEDVPGPQNFEEIAEVEKAVPEEGISERTVVQTVGVPVPQNFDEIVEVVRAVKLCICTNRSLHVSAERVQIVDVRSGKDRVEAGSAPHERVQQRTVEQRIVVELCQRLRSWKRSSRRVPPHMNECNSEPSSSRSLTPQIRTVLKTVELRRIPNPISQNLLMKDLRKRRNAPESGAGDTGAEDKDPETAGPGLVTAGLGAGSADLPAG